MKKKRPTKPTALATAPAPEEIVAATIPKRAVSFPTLLRRVNRAIAPQGYHVSKRFKGAHRLENRETGVELSPTVNGETLARIVGALGPHERLIQTTKRTKHT